MLCDVSKTDSSAGLHSKAEIDRRKSFKLAMDNVGFSKGAPVCRELVVCYQDHPPPQDPSHSCPSTVIFHLHGASPVVPSPISTQWLLRMWMPRMPPSPPTPLLFTWPSLASHCKRRRYVSKDLYTFVKCCVHINSMYITTLEHKSLQAHWCH